MRFASLVGKIRTAGARKGGLLLIIPCFNEYGVLLEHLRLLARQDFSGFDLLLVLGPDFPAGRLERHLRGKKYAFSITYAKRKEDTGSAGGFFTGQKYALENGYGHMMLADADCLPLDKTLLSGLWQARHNKVVSSSVRFIGPGGALLPANPVRGNSQSSFSFYTMMPCSLAMRHGLYFAPLYCGYEDAEYMHRLGIGRSFVKSRTTHPGSKAAFFTRPEKALAYAANQAEFAPFPALPRFFLANCPLLASLFLFYGRRGQGLVAGFFKSIFLFAYGKRAIQIIRASAPAEAKARPELDASAIIAYAPQRLASIASFFRKDAEINPSSKIGVKGILLLSALSRRLYWREPGKGRTLLCDNISALPHLLSIAIFPFAAVALFLLFVLFLPIKLACRPKTLGFGIDKEASS